MDNVEIKPEEGKTTEAAPAKVKKQKKDAKKVAFMESRNEARKKAGQKPAYSKEQIEAYK